jgi:hypothetical protein
MSITVHPYVPTQANKRGAAYVAPTTESATFQVVAVNGAAVTGQPIIEQDLVATAPGCTTSGATVTCSTTVPVIVGTVTFQVKTYDQTGASGTQLGTSLASTTIVANQANRIALTVSGVIAQVQLFLGPSSLTAGTAGRSLLVVVPQDADGNIIVNPGNYDQPIQLSLSGGVVGTSPTAHVGFEEDGATTPSGTATVTSPNDQVYVAYDGTAGVSPASITATVAEATPVAATASLAIGSASLTPTLGGSNLQNAGFAFTGGNQTGSITLSGGTPPYFASFTPPGTPTSVARKAGAASRHTLGDTPIATATVSGSTVTVTSLAGEYGTATLYISDSSPGGDEFTVPISVSAPAITITGTACSGGASCLTSQTDFSATSTGSVTLNYGGGTGTYTNTFASTGSGSSACVTVTGSAATYTFTSTGSCSDLLIVTSGNQTAYYAFVQGTGTASYTLASAAHAYSPSIGVIAIAYDGISTLPNASQATIALTAGNGPWTTSQSGCSPYLSITAAITSGASPSPSLNNSAFVLAVTTNPSAEVTSCFVTFTPTSGSPSTLQILLYPKLTISQQTFALHAPGDNGSVTVANYSPGGLTLSSNSVEIASQSTTGVLTNLTYTAGTVGFTAGTVSGTSMAQAGTALVSIHDTNFDEKFGVSVTVDNAYAQELPSAIGLEYLLGTQTATTYSNAAIPSFAQSVTSPSGDVAVSFNPGVPYGTLQLTPNGAESSTLSVADSAGGTVTVPVTAFSVQFNDYPGSAIGATSAEAFPSVGLQDVVTVSGPSGAFTVVSSNPSVVSVTPGTNQFTATSVATGFATITITDSSNGASISYQASVTNVTIPILGHPHKNR